MVLKENFLLIFTIIIVWILSIYFLIKLYTKLILGRGDIKIKKGYEKENITFIKWLALAIVSISMSFLMMMISKILGFIVFIITLIIALLLVGNLIKTDDTGGKVLYPWDWWILKLIEKKKK